MCGRANQIGILSLARGLPTYNLVPQFFDLLIDVWFLGVTDLLVVINLDWCALHADSSLAHLALLSEVKALIRVKVTACHVA